MRYRKHRAAIERMYTDRCMIRRNIEVTAANHETKLQPVILYSDQPCRLSQSGLAANDQNAAQNDIRYESKLFIAPELDLRQGDIVEVTRGEITPTGWVPIAAARKYEAGEPFPPYVTHQEVSLQRRDYA